MLQLCSLSHDASPEVSWWIEPEVGRIIAHVTRPLSLSWSGRAELQWTHAALHSEISATLSVNTGIALEVTTTQPRHIWNIFRANISTTQTHRLVSYSYHDKHKEIQTKTYLKDYYYKRHKHPFTNRRLHEKI